MTKWHLFQVLIRISRVPDLHIHLGLQCPADFTGPLAVWKVTVCLEEMMLSTLRTFLDARIQSLDVSQGLENDGKALVKKEVIIGEKCRAKLKTVYPILRYKERAGEEDQVRNDTGPASGENMTEKKVN